MYDISILPLSSHVFAVLSLKCLAEKFCNRIRYHIDTKSGPAKATEQTHTPHFHLIFRILSCIIMEVRASPANVAQKSPLAALVFEVSDVSLLLFASEYMHVSLPCSAPPLNTMIVSDLETKLYVLIFNLLYCIVAVGDEHDYTPI